MIRRLGIATLVAGTVAGFAAGGSASASVRLDLPEATGKSPVGTVALHLVDRSRPDPWSGRALRELMVSVWYPAHDIGPRATYLQPAAAERLATDLDSWGGVPAGSVDFGAVRTHARDGAPVDGRRGPLPVILFSPGHLGSRALNTSLVADLASHGYVVVTVDHTHESIVDFPGGRVAPALVPLPDVNAPDFLQQVIEFNRTTIAARVADTSTVLDSLTVLAAGENPDAEGRRLPRGLGRALDLSRVGMFGHSAGGASTAEAMYYDERISAGAVVDSGLGYDFDGDVVPPVVTEGLDRPVLLLSSEGANPTHVSDPSVAAFWANQRGWKRDLQLTDSKHIVFADYTPLLSQLVAAGAVQLKPGQTPQDYLADQLGTVPPAEAINSTRAYLRAFFDLHLLRYDSGLFDGPSPAHPYITFI